MILPEKCNDIDTVDIVLATYNGAKYLARQLDSLLAQRHGGIRILVSDDGSSDNTVEVVREYCTRDSRVVLVSTVRQGGVVANFTKALSFSNAEYVMFCDQDDVWLDTKVGTMLRALKERERVVGAATPLLCFSDLAVVNVHLDVEHPSFYESNNLNPFFNTDSRYLVWSSTVYGCTTVFNRSLVALGREMPSGLPMHDQWFALLAATVGEVIYVPLQTISYRQHDDNVVGGKRKTFVKRLLSFGSNVSVVLRDVRKCRLQYAACASLLRGHGIPLPPVFRYRLCRISDRLEFVRRNVAPFVRERSVYALLFAVFFLIVSDDH